MKKFRKIVFWCHLATGLLAGIVIFIMSVTGVLLTYERQMLWWADTRGYDIEAPESAERAPVAELLEKARNVNSATPSAIVFYADPEAPARVSYGRSNSLFVNPYSGEVLGKGSPAAHSVVSFTRGLHRWLAADGESRAIGRAITGACNLGFLFLVVSGFYLWWPRRWSKPSLRAVTLFQRGLSGRARDFNWHNVIGFWVCIPLFVVVASATVISYPWAKGLVYGIFGETVPERRRSSGGNEETALEQSAYADLDRFIARTEEQVPNWRNISLSLPEFADEPISVSVDSGTGGQPQKRATLTFVRETGEVSEWAPFASQTPGNRARSILRFAHTGEVAGIGGQTIAGIASAGAAILVCTGFMLTWRRFRGWRKSRR